MISKVTEGIYRGPRLDDLSPLRDLGIKTILNLEDDMDAVSMEMIKVFRALQIPVISMPMSEIKRPSKLNLVMAVGYLQKDKEYPIYVHCLHGKDRTGYVIAAYRMLVQGWSFDKAFQEAKDMGHSWYLYWFLGWPKSLKELS